MLFLYNVFSGKICKLSPSTVLIATLKRYRIFNDTFFVLHLQNLIHCNTIISHENYFFLTKGGNFLQILTYTFSYIGY